MFYSLTKNIIGTVTVLIAVHVVKVTAGDELGPISVCTYEGEHIADKGSCTRYYKCREDDLGLFVTDLLVCPDDSVFDMVTDLCNETTTHYWQDPSSCTQFYGCHATKETSEGFIRQQYHCPGDLRFHPIERFCTFKTKVPDILCNSRADEQSIIGTDEIYLRRHRNNLAGRTTRLSTFGTLGEVTTKDETKPYRTSSRSGFRSTSQLTTLPDVQYENQPTPLSDVSAVALAIKKQLMEDSIVKIPDSVITHENLAADKTE